MGQIKSFIALSLDGFIASVDGELDWIPQSVRAIPKSLFEIAYYSVLIHTIIFLSI